MRAGLRTAREESRESRQARDDAEQRARTLAERVRELEARAEMAEVNLRTVLASARAKDIVKQGAVSDSEMEAILGILKTGEEPRDASETGEVTDHAGAPPSPDRVVG